MNCNGTCVRCPRKALTTGARTQVLGGRIINLAGVTRVAGSNHDPILLHGNVPCEHPEFRKLLEGEGGCAAHPGVLTNAGLGGQFAAV